MGSIKAAPLFFKDLILSIPRKKNVRYFKLKKINFQTDSNALLCTNIIEGFPLNVKKILC